MKKEKKYRKKKEKCWKIKKKRQNTREKRILHWFRMTGIWAALFAAGIYGFQENMGNQCSGNYVSAAEKEEEQTVIVESVQVKGPEGKKVYDGTRSVELEVQVKWPDGEVPDSDWVKVEALGFARSSDVGIWKVDAECRLTGPGAKQYVLECRRGALETQVEIVPKILTVEIADAVKPYHSEMNAEHLIFPQDTKPVKISGFMKNGEETEEIPSGFVMPELVLDKRRIDRNSPIYRDGKYILYEAAITLDTGRLTGSMRNYTYRLEDTRYTRKGNVTLFETEPEKEDFSVTVVKGNAVWIPQEGEYRVTPGTILEICPRKDSGYNQTISSGILKSAGTWTFCLLRTGKDGKLLARSGKLCISYRVDQEAPAGRVLLNGKEQAEFITAETCLCSMADVTDNLSGTIETAWYVSKKKEDTERLAAEKGIWKKGNSMKISSEGVWYPYVRLKDIAGNVRCLSGGRVILDCTAPRLLLDGLQTGKILTGNFCTELRIKDENLNQEKTVWKLYSGNGRKKEEKTQCRGETLVLACQEGKSREKQRIVLEDGWYMLHILAVDVAGNRKEQTISFSVNCGGPDIRIVPETESFLKQRYHRKGGEVGFLVKDVHDLTEERFLCVTGERFLELEMGRDYQVVRKLCDDGTREYRYTIPAEYFSEEDRYGFELFVKDAAGNAAKSSREGQMAEFLLDRTPPVCTVYAIQEKEKKLEVEIVCSDNYQFAGLCVQKNGQEIKKTDKEKLVMELDFSSKGKWELTAWDAAGNKERVELSEQELKEELEQKKLLNREEKGGKTEKEGLQTGKTEPKKENSSNREKSLPKEEKPEKRQEAKTGAGRWNPGWLCVLLPAAALLIVLKKCTGRGRK